MHYTYGDMPMALAKVDMLTGDTTNVFQFADLAEPDVEQTAWYNGRYKYLCLLRLPIYSPIKRQHE